MVVEILFSFFHYYSLGRLERLFKINEKYIEHWNIKGLEFVWDIEICDLLRVQITAVYMGGSYALTKEGHPPLPALFFLVPQVYRSQQ
jgi:hypothetical protein